MFGLFSGSVTYQVDEDSQAVLKYLARQLNVAPGAILGMGVAVIEAAVRVQGNDACVITIDKKGKMSCCKLSDYMDYVQSQKE